MTDDSRAHGSAFGFSGTWQDYAPIAFTNLLLQLVTLGLYTFWARARTRRYLWSRTRFIDDRLEWTGTGTELFVGYLLAFVFLLVPLGALQFVIQGIVLRGHQGTAIALGALLYLALLFLVGVARLRALRYRLSRTWWHGIRGGSDAQGIGYGGQYLWRTLAGMLPLGLAVPWSMTTLWNRRWATMSFGTMRFSAAARWQPVFARFLLFYLAPIVLALAAAALVLGLMAVGGADGLAPGKPPRAGTIVAFVVMALMFYAVFFGVLGVIALLFYSAFFREAVGATRLGPLSFGFGATTMDWVKLFVGNVALVIATLGIGYIFLAYRNWAFLVRHLEAYGELPLDLLAQSTTRAPGQGEGLLDAFDIGAI